MAFPQHAGRPQRVLICHEAWDVARILALVLHRAGHAVRTGQEVLAETRSFRPVIVVLDVAWPDGRDAARLLQMDSPQDERVCVALSKDWGEETLSWCRETGFDFLVRKPVDPVALRLLVGSLPQAPDWVPLLPNYELAVRPVSPARVAVDGGVVPPPARENGRDATGRLATSHVTSPDGRSTGRGPESAV